MAFTKLTENLNVISSLSDRPNAIDSLSASALKAKFDEAAGKIKTYINNTLTEEMGGTQGAANIGIIGIAGLVSNTIQTALSEIAGILFNHRARHEAGGADAITVTSGMMANNAVTAGAIANNAVSTVYTATIATGWSGTTAPYSKVVTINGILATDEPVIDLAPSDTYATAEPQIEQWGYVYRAVTAANTITFYATEKPTVALPIKVRCIRK